MPSVQITPVNKTYSYESKYSTMPRSYKSNYDTANSHEPISKVSIENKTSNSKTKTTKNGNTYVVEYENVEASEVYSVNKYDYAGNNSNNSFENSFLLH